MYKTRLIQETFMESKKIKSDNISKISDSRQTMIKKGEMDKIQSCVEGE